MTTTNGRPMSLREMAMNAMSFSRTWLAQQLDPRRDLSHECGYPESLPDSQFYQSLYDRDPIAARVVEVYPRESWASQPTVYEEEDAETVTAFEDAWDAVGKGLRGDRSFYQDEAGSPIWEALSRVDILSGIGRYGVMLLGLDDGMDLSEPAVFRAGQRLLFLRCFPESMAPITQSEPDIGSPRFGQPIQYAISFADPRDQSAPLGVTGTQLTTLNVHWSRVIHVADVGHTATSSEVYAVERLRAVLNRILDLRKVYGADAEAYWKNAIQRLFFETNPNLGGDVDIDTASLKDDMEQMENGLQRWMGLKGLSAKVIPPAVVDPMSHIHVQIEAICVKLGIPKRIFLGSERGELASSQDDASWNDRLRDRQRNYLTPRLIVPFVDRLILLGVLPEPAGYSVDWPDLTSQSDQEKATVFLTRMQAWAQYVSGNVESILPPMDVLTREAGYNEEEARVILEEAEKLAEAKEEEEAEKMAEQAELMPPSTPVGMPPQRPQLRGEPNGTTRP